MQPEFLFDSTHHALRFAFEYFGSQSPKTPLMSLTAKIEGSMLGSGKGLSGYDAAAQAGMILAEVCRLQDDRHNVIVASYCRSKIECKCCGQDVYREEWNTAIDALSHCYELDGVHRKVRNMIVKVAVCGGRLDIDSISRQYSLGRSTTYKQLAKMKEKIRKIHKLALIDLDNALSEKNVIAA